MSIYTPRGLKIRFSIPYSFALMARLFPEVTPFKVLKTTEGIEAIPDALMVIEAFIIMFFFPWATPIKICLVVLLTYFVGYLMKSTGLFFIPLIVPISELFTYIQGYGIITVALVLVGYFKLGLLKAIIMLGAIIFTNIFDFILEMARAFWYRHNRDSYLTISELDFINAYMLCAARIGVSTSPTVPPAEIEAGHWEGTYYWLKNNYPEVCSRMPIYETGVEY